MAAAIAIEIEESISPTPMRCKCVMPVGIPVNFRRSGTQIRSYTGMMMIKKTMGMIGRDAGGMLKFLVMLVSMVKPCWTEKVWSCARQRVIIIEQQNIGSMLRMILAFSTWVTLQSCHGLVSSGLSDCSSEFLWMAALSKNLCKRNFNLEQDKLELK